MPNWCKNTLRVTGPKASVSEFQIKFEEPHPVSNPDVRSLFRSLNLRELLSDFGARLTGGPLEAHEIQLVDDWDDGLIYEFDTAWSPPLEIIQQLSRHWPDLVFILDYEESGEGYKGLAKAAAGQLEDHCIDL